VRPVVGVVDPDDGPSNSAVSRQSPLVSVGATVVGGAASSMVTTEPRLLRAALNPF
jgi:hypothetical protein